MATIGKEDWLWRLAINNPQNEIPLWSKRFRLISSSTFWQNFPKLKEFKPSTKFLIKLAENLKMAHFVKLDFST